MARFLTLKGWFNNTFSKPISVNADQKAFLKKEKGKRRIEIP
jgi:hypothetical protein